MRKVFLLAGIVSLSLTMPAVAKPGGNGQGHAKSERAGGKHKGGKRVSHERTRADRSGYRDRDDRFAGGGRNCPPGIAKKNNGCLPPGQAKKFALGQRLPSLFNRYNVPEQYRDEYRDTNEDLFRYDDGNLYRVDAKTRVIEEVIRLLGR